MMPRTSDSTCDLSCEPKDSNVRQARQSDGHLGVASSFSLNTYGRGAHNQALGTHGARSLGLQAESKPGGQHKVAKCQFEAKAALSNLKRRH
jgi:hypothetical protein